MKKRILGMFLVVLLMITCFSVNEPVQAADDFMFLVTNSYKTLEPIDSISRNTYPNYPHSDYIYVSPGKTFTITRDSNVAQDINLWWRFRTPGDGISATVNGKSVPTRQDTYNIFGSSYYYYYGGSNLFSTYRTATVTVDSSTPIGRSAVLENKNGTSWMINDGNNAVQGNDYNVFYIYVAQECSIKYDFNDGTSRSNSVTGYTTKISNTSQNIPIPGAPTTRTGYAFDGWKSAYYKNATPYKEGTNYRVMGDDTLTAQWIPINYTISYTLNGGTVNPANPTSYNIETETFTLNNPERAGYIFLGWTGSNGTTPSKSVEIKRGTTENLSYTANWQKVPQYTDAAYTVEYYTKPYNGEYQLKEAISRKGQIGTKPVYDEISYIGYSKVEEEVPDVIKKDGSTVVRVYYDEITATISYKSVNSSYGTVSLESEGTIGVVSGIVNGSTAQAKDGYKFSGWYIDEGCTKPVTSNWIQNQKLTPRKIDGVYSNATYYAKFEPTESEIEISMHVDGDYADKTKEFKVELSIEHFGNSITEISYHLADGKSEVHKAESVHTVSLASINTINNYKLMKITYKLPNSMTEIEFNITNGITNAVEIPEGVTEFHVYYERINVIETGMNDNFANMKLGIIGAVGGIGVLLIVFWRMSKKFGYHDE